MEFLQLCLTSYDSGRAPVRNPVKTALGHGRHLHAVTAHKKKKKEKKNTTTNKRSQEKQHEINTIRQQQFLPVRSGKSEVM